jgi:hypothetical protein
VGKETTMNPTTSNLRPDGTTFPPVTPDPPPPPGYVDPIPVLEAALEGASAEDEAEGDDAAGDDVLPDGAAEDEHRPATSRGPTSR